ncbi:alpha-amylase [Aspergillus heteromorphus CBS 117.55]|uniref:alpha-amylase n=1 Tax=Aspergillus heteromorphus CBS 117.55 TaxID=1448321 RepID=A0A317WMN9_9EURO|nr:alpha-amylase [Aspergillus heteromorphus CBS 117.55]PWY87724.1 alpha-amylase [Aspergillus heteromorphus CBS 117.55]
MKDILLLIVALAATVVLGASPAQWRTQSIYFLLTDRFARTDNSTTAACNTGERQYCGGTWQGIINQLDYIQGMGFTAIWITPVTGQIPQETGYGEAYHGYWQQDAYTLNSHYGTADDLKKLASAVHARGMYLMVDVVANHMAFNGSGDATTYSAYNPFNSQEYFHNLCSITNNDNQTQVEDCWLADSVVSLPDLNTTRSDVKTMWYDWIGSLVSNYSIDGLRIDTVKNVQKDFWPGYNKAAGVYCVGEVFDGDAEFTCPYQNDLDGVLDYPMYYPLLRAFESTNGSISDLYNMINTVKSTCNDSTLLGTFVENHDNPRFANYTSDMSLAKNAASFTVLADGIPIIYAGQEQHYHGGNDPYNREATWLSSYSTTSPLYTHIATSNRIRTHAIGQDSGYITYKNYPIYQDNSTLAMRKGYNGTQTITVLSNLGASGRSYNLSLPGTGYSANQKLTELYTCTNVTVDADGSVPVPMASGLPRVLYPADKLSNSSLCGHNSTTS